MTHEEAVSRFQDEYGDGIQGTLECSCMGASFEIIWDMGLPYGRRGVIAQIQSQDGDILTVELDYYGRMAGEDREWHQTRRVTADELMETISDAIYEDMKPRWGSAA